MIDLYIEILKYGSKINKYYMVGNDYLGLDIYIFHFYIKQKEQQ